MTVCAKFWRPLSVTVTSSPAQASAAVTPVSVGLGRTVSVMTLLRPEREQPVAMSVIVLRVTTKVPGTSVWRVPVTSSSLEEIVAETAGLVPS